MCREAGFTVAQYDWDYDAKGMNFFSSGGFASGSISSFKVGHLHDTVPYPVWSLPHGARLQQLDRGLESDLEALRNEPLGRSSAGVG